MSAEKEQQSLTDQIIGTALADLAAKPEFPAKVLTKLADLASAGQLKKPNQVAVALREE